MVPLLAAVGLPLLLKAVQGALGAIDSPVAKVAASALADVGDALASSKITPQQVAEANRHLERMAELDSDEAKAVLSQINQSLRAEIASEDPYVRRWRPTFGYAVAVTWVLTMSAIAWAIVVQPGQAPAIIAALVNTSPIWGIALGVLGVAVVKRSQDKSATAQVRTTTGPGPI